MSIRWKKYLWQEPLPATPRDIARHEQAWGVVLPGAYKQVIAIHQGIVFMTVEADLLPVAEDFTHFLRSLYDSEA